MRKQTVQQWANSIARGYGRGKATDFTVVLGGHRIEVIESIRPGYRKNTTGEYVSSAYRRNFGWKNTFYQPAVFEIEIPYSLIAHCTDALGYLREVVHKETGHVMLQVTGKEV